MKLEGCGSDKAKLYIESLESDLNIDMAKFNQKRLGKRIRIT